jgi:hypothetical protein
LTTIPGRALPLQRVRRLFGHRRRCEYGGHACQTRQRILRSFPSCLPTTLPDIPARKRRLRRVQPMGGSPSNVYQKSTGRLTPTITSSTSRRIPMGIAGSAGVECPSKWRSYKRVGRRSRQSDPDFCGRQRVTSCRIQDPADFCRKMAAAFGAEVYRSSTDDSGLEKSAGGRIAANSPTGRAISSTPLILHGAAGQAPTLYF